MRRLRIGVVLVAACACVGGGARVEGKTFRYSSGPKAPTDTVLSTAQTEVEPIVRARGPKVPATNLQMTEMVANVAFDRALQAAPLDSGMHVTIAPAGMHPLNFMVEHAILKHFTRRGVVATVRRQPLPEDSALAVAVTAEDPVLEYQLASARVTYLRLVGWLPGRVKIERQALVEGQLTMRDPRSLRVLWTGDASYNLLDAFPKGQLSLVEDNRYADLRGQPPTRNIDKVVEPVIVVAIIAGLVALFFQNRP
jgi:hypothetical protein